MLVRGEEHGRAIVAAAYASTLANPKLGTTVIFACNGTHGRQSRLLLPGQLGEVLLCVGADLGGRPCGDALRHLLPFAAVHLEPLEELLVLFPRPSAR